MRRRVLALLAAAGLPACFVENVTEDRGAEGAGSPPVIVQDVTVDVTLRLAVDESVRFDQRVDDCNLGDWLQPGFRNDITATCSRVFVDYTARG